MKERLNNLRKNRKKGFTLVELIVVLVILAILAALLIPSLTGYIDKAKGRGVIAETRSCVMACQTLADEEYGKNSADYDDTDDNKTAVKNLAEAPGTINSFTVEGGVVTELSYTNGKTCTYTYNKTTHAATYSDPS